MKNITNVSILVVRVLLGLVFLVSGLNGFLGFIPMPPPPAGATGAFMGGLAASGYFFPFLKGTETLVGLLLLSGRLVPLALIALAPIMLNIAAFHLFLARDGLIMALLFGAMQLYLAWSYRDAYAGVLTFNALPKAKQVSCHAHDAPPDALKGTA